MRKGSFFRSKRFLFLDWAIIPFLIYSCSCWKSVENNSTLTERTKKEVKELEEKQKNSTMADIQRDTVIVRDSTVVNQRGDTVMVDRWHTQYITKWKDRTVTDTIIMHLARDSTGHSTLVQESKQTLKHDTWTKRELLILAAFITIGFFSTIYYFLKNRRTLS